MLDGSRRRGAGDVWAPFVTDDAAPIGRVLVVSDIRFVREGLALVLSQDEGFTVLGQAADREECAALLGRICPPEIVLLDAGLPQGHEFVGFLRNAVAAQIVVFSVNETEEEVLAWAEAGVSAYLARSTSLTDVVATLHRIRRGEQPCSAQVAAGLLRRLAEGSWRPAAPPALSGETLTSREAEVAQFILAGLSNKEIARRLLVGVPTVKSHVHNILGKLQLTRRSQLASRLR